MISASPEVLDVGLLDPGQAAAGGVALKNVADEAATIVATRVSCPCVQVDPRPFPMALGPGDEATLKLSFRSDEEPEFRGTMQVVVEGLDGSGRRLLRFRVKATVR